jgi:predicted dehydrogenase
VDWRALIDDPQVQVVCVTAPNAVHREIGVAVARAGKHLWIEKPVGLGSADARAVAKAVEAAGVQAAVGFNYRNFPAVERAREIIRDGQIGDPTNAYVCTNSDYAAHPGGTLSWRYSIAQGGHGILADLGSHGFDLIRYLLGDLHSLVADTATFIPTRPLATAGASHFAIADPDDPDVAKGEVENQDFVSTLVRTASGVRVLYEASRTSVGDQCTYGFVVHGTRGQVSWDFRRSDELCVSRGASYQNQPTEHYFGTPGDGEYSRFQPGAGIAISYDDSKVVELARLVLAITTGEVRGATIRDAVSAAEANEAVLRSAATGQWVPVGEAAG